MIKANNQSFLKKHDNKIGRDSNETRFYREYNTDELRPYKSFLLANFSNINERVLIEQAWNRKVAKKEMVRLSFNSPTEYLIPLLDFKGALFFFAEKNESVKWTMLDDRIDENIELHKHKKVKIPDFNHNKEIIFEIGWNKMAKEKAMLKITIKEIGDYIFRRIDLEELLWFLMEGKRVFSFSAVSDIERRIYQTN